MPFKTRRRLPNVLAALHDMSGFFTAIGLIALVCWIADQTLRDVLHIRRNRRRRGLRP
jgi:hypothetical protein